MLEKTSRQKTLKRIGSGPPNPDYVAFTTSVRTLQYPTPVLNTQSGEWEWAWPRTGYAERGALADWVAAVRQYLVDDLDRWAEDCYHMQRTFLGPLPDSQFSEDDARPAEEEQSVIGAAGDST